MEWSPKKKIVFTDEEIVRALATTPDTPAARKGNLWTFYETLPKPERERLAEAAGPPPEATPDF